MPAGDKRRCWIGSLFFFCFISLFFLNLLGYAGDWKAAVVMDSSGKIVYSRNVNKLLPPASTIKVLSAMVVVDHLSLDKWAMVSKKAAVVEPTKLYLGVGRYYRVKDLLYAMLMGSANDAAVALSEAVAGSEKRFAGLMRKKLNRCGIKNAVVTNASGLPDRRQKISVLGLAKLMQIALKYGIICDALTRKVFYFYDRQGVKKIRVVNHNKLLWSRCWKLVKGKTGFTRAAGQCFLGYFYYKGKYYILCFLGGRTLWKNIKELVRKVTGRGKCLSG